MQNQSYYQERISRGKFKLFLTYVLIVNLALLQVSLCQNVKIQGKRKHSRKHTVPVPKDFKQHETVQSRSMGFGRSMGEGGMMPEGEGWSAPNRDGHNEGLSAPNPEGHNEGWGAPNPEEHNEGLSAPGPEGHNQGSGAPGPEGHNEGWPATGPEGHNQGWGTPGPGDHTEVMSNLAPGPTEKLKTCPPNSHRMEKVYQPDQSTHVRIATQNLHLTLTAHKIAVFGPEAIVGDLENHEPRNSLKLLNKTGELFKHFCPLSVIPEIYIDNIIQIYMILHRFAQPKRNSYLTDEETGWIIKLLDKCQEVTPSPFKLNEKCSDDIVADGVKNEPICPPFETRFHPQAFDPLLDVIFKMYELTHSNCFESFQGFSRVWHRYTMGIEDLFSLPMRQRWAAAGGDNRFWKQILGPNYMDFNENIDKCVHYYAMESPLHLRLQRFHQGYSIRYGAVPANIYGKME